MTKHRFDIFGMALSLAIWGVCLVIPAQWPVVFVWAFIAIYFGSEVILRGKQ